MNKHQGNGVLLGIFITIIIIVLGLAIWLYGDKIKKDINDKLKNDSEITQEEPKQDTTITITLLSPVRGQYECKSK